MSIRAWSKSLILLSLFALGACAQPPLPQERVLQYWEAVKLADWQTAWELEHKAQTKEENPFQYYDRMRRQMRIAKVELGEIKTQGSTAQLEVRLDRVLPFASGQYRTPETLEDRWIYADGAWWHLETMRPQPEAGEQPQQEGTPAEAAPAGEAGISATQGAEGQAAPDATPRPGGQSPKSE